MEQTLWVISIFKTEVVQYKILIDVIKQCRKILCIDTIKRKKILFT